MRVLVTGGAGFIGLHVVRALADAGADVVVVDRLDPAAHDGVPEDLDPRATYHWADVRDPATWRRLLPGSDAVCHQAARVGLGVDPGDVRDYVSNNDVGTAEMLWAMHDQRWRGRLVQASSMVVYGDGAYRCVDHGLQRPPRRPVADLDAGRFDPACPGCGRRLEPVAVDESAATDPRNTYAATKLHQEHLAAAFGAETGVPVLSLRYHNVYGPGMPRDTPYAGVAAIFRSQLEAGGPPVVFEDGGQLRDFVHVTDVARANVLALLAEEPVTGAVNVATGRAFRLVDMARTLSSAVDGPPPVVTGRYRIGDVRHVLGSPVRARDLFGFSARIPPDEGLREFASAPLRRPAPLA